MTPDDRCASSAARNHFVLHRRDALSAGLSERSIARRLESGRWRLLYPKVYFVGYGPIPYRSRLAAALEWAGDGALASHTSAGSLLRLVPRTDQIIITSARRINPAHGIEVHFDPHVTTEPLVKVDGIRVTPMARTVLDLCRYSSRNEAVTLVERAVRGNHVTLDSLARRAEGSGPAQGRRRRPYGAETLEWVLRHRFAQGVTDSELEDLYIRHARKERLPAIHHHVVYDGRQRVGELDFAYLPEFVNVEVDGDESHADPVSASRDKARDAQLVSLGWAVIRVTYWQLVTEPDVIFGRVRRTLETRRAA